MQLKFLAVFSLIFLIPALLLASGIAHADSELMNPLTDSSGQVRTPFPLQGNCVENGINLSDPGINQQVSTWACHGSTGGDKMLFISYREGPTECVYIDNFNNDGGQIRAFFVPLKTSDEWLAFRSPGNLPGGVTLRTGCPKTIFEDPCGNPFQLPDQPVSDAPEDNIQIATKGDYKAAYQCTDIVGNPGNTRTGLESGCGAWLKRSESGDCHPKTPPAL